MPDSDDSFRIDRFLAFNALLERQMDLLQLNERVIESHLEELESMISVSAPCVSNPIGKYSLCRLAELTLFCVGNYANNNCTTQVGDFMINPRLILVHIKGEPRPVIKKRHTRLSEQFKEYACKNCTVAEWLSFNTMTEIVKKPILPHLLDLLKDNDCAYAYIQSVKKRMNSILDLLSHLHMANIPGHMDVEQWTARLPENDRAMMKSLFFKFDFSVFNVLGEKIRSICQEPLFA